MARDLNLSVTLSAINKATGPLKQILQGSRGAGRAIRETRDQLRNLNDQQKRITAFRDMSRQSHATRRALMDKREELRQISRQLETTQGPTRRLTQQQANAQREVDKLSREYRGQRDQVRELARALPPGIEGTRGLTQQNEALARQIEATNRRLERQQNALRRLGDADVGGRFRAMTGETRRFARNVTFATTLAAGSIFGLANSTATLGDDIAKTADIMGIGTTELQELRYAAERAGVGTDNLDSSMQRMVRRVGRAAQGGGAAAQAYEDLGLNARELADMRPERALGVIADRLNDVETQTDKVAYASAIFGNAGEGMLNMIKGGSGELAELRRQAQETGYVLEGASTRSAEDFKDALLDTQLSMKGMKNTIGAELMPAVAELMREFTGWMRENREQVRAFAREFGERLKAAVPVIIEITKGAAAFASTLGRLVARAADLAGGADRLALILGGLFAAKMIMSVVMFGVSLVKAGAALASLAATLPGLISGIKALGLAFMATPLGWVVAAITAIGAGAIYLWRNWETIGPRFRALWDGIKTRAAAAWDWLKGLFRWSPLATLRRAWEGVDAIPGRAMQAIRTAVDGGLADVGRLLLDWSPAGLLHRALVGGLERLGIEVPDQFRSLGGWIIDGLIGGVRNGFADVGAAIRDLAGSIIGRFREILGIRSPSTVFEGVGGDIVQGIIQGIAGMAGALRDQVRGLAGDIAGWMQDAIGSAWASGKEIARGIGEGVKDGARQAGQAVREGAGAAWDAGRDTARGMGEGIKRGAGRATDAASDMARDATDTVRDWLRIRSPSRVFQRLGEHTASGLARGIQRHTEEPARQAANMARRVRQAGAGLALGATASVAVAGSGPEAGDGIAFDTRPPMAAASAGSDLVIHGGINIEIHAAPGMDEQALARLVDARVQHALRQAARDQQARQRSALYDVD
jgi:hypothetical protein